MTGAITMWQMSRGMDRTMGMHGLGTLGLALALVALSYVHTSVFAPALSASMTLTGWTIFVLYTHVGTVLAAALAGLFLPIPLLFFVWPGLVLGVAIALIVFVAESAFGEWLRMGQSIARGVRESRL